MGQTIERPVDAGGGKEKSTGGHAGPVREECWVRVGRTGFIVSPGMGGGELFPVGRDGLDVKFLLPKKSADNEAILDAARGMAQVSEQHAEVFVQQEGLPAEFVQQLRSAIDALATALTVRVESLRRKSTSGEAVTKLVKRGVAVVEVLDAIVAPKLAGQSDLLATWKLVKKPVEVGGGSGLAATVDITPVVRVA